MSTVDQSLLEIKKILSGLSNELASVNAKMDKAEKSSISRFDGVRKEIDAEKSEMSSLKSDLLSTKEMVVDKLTTVRHSIESMRADAESTTRVLRALEGEMTATNNSMNNVATAFVHWTEKFDSSKSEFESLKTAIESFEGGISAIKLAISQQSSTLSQLKSDSVETKAENKDISEAIKQSVLESHSATRQHLSAKSTMMLMWFEKYFPDFFKNVCVDSLVGKTVIHGNDSSKLSNARSLYERLYSKGPLVSILTKFLLFHPKVRVHLDFGSSRIERMKGEFINFDGEKQKGSDWDSFPVLEEEKVYLGGSRSDDYFIAWLVRSLCTMCFHLLYKNGGLPFKKIEGEPETEKNWEKMLEESEGKKGRGEGLGWFSGALDKKTREGKLIDLISIVPFTIALNGSSKGIQEVRKWLPSAIDLYEQQVVPDLTRDWEAKMATWVP